MRLRSSTNKKEFHMSHKKYAAFLTLVALILAANSGCVSQTAVQKALVRSETLPLPVLPQRPVDPILADFAAMLGAYVTAATGESSIPIEIDYIGNESGIDKELPTDLGQFARNAIEKIGKPLQTYRAWPAISGMPRPVGNSLALLPSDHPRPPQPSYRLVGSLLRASERLATGRDARADGLFGGGHSQTDAQLTGEHRRTITALTVALTLESPNGVAVSGATAEYRISVERSELNRSFSVYVAGSGIGSGTKVTATQDSGDALYDAIAVSVMHLLGNALLVPYYRCSPMFAADDALDARVHDALSRLTMAEMEQNLKRYLFLDGFFMDMRAPGLTEADRAVVVLEMRRRSLEFGDRKQMVDFAMDLWRKLDFKKASQRVADRMTLSAQAQREKAASVVAEQGELAAISPADFGWPSFVHFVVVDLSRVKEVSIQNQILAAVRSCDGCYDVRAHPKKMVLGVRISSQPFEIQRALRATSLRLNYEWSNSTSPRLLVVPAA
jgi:hypothetical protein